MSQIEDVPATGARDEAAAASRHGYPATAMVGDYLRAAAGLVPSGLLLATVPVGTVAAIVLGGVAALFAVFGARTLLRHGSSLEMTADGLRSAGPRRTAIAWSDLDRMKLAYYSTSRDRRAGWMQLELGAGPARIRLDSRIDRFDEIVRRAAAVAGARRIYLGETTLANLHSLGVSVSEAEGDR